MFSAWDFNSWISSIGVVLVMLFLLTGFSALGGRKGARSHFRLVRARRLEIPVFCPPSVDMILSPK